MKQFSTALILAVLLTAGQSTIAEDASLCLDCHEPAEDWEGMSAEEILAAARSAEIKRHADNQDLSDEDLQAIIATLLQE